MIHVAGKQKIYQWQSEGDQITHIATPHSPKDWHYISQLPQINSAVFYEARKHHNFVPHYVLLSCQQKILNSAKRDLFKSWTSSVDHGDDLS